MDVITLTSAQQNIFDTVTYNVHNYPGRYDCVIQGYAGTGKSTTISRIISELMDSYTIAVTSPTHKANHVLRSMLLDAGVDCVGSKADVVVSTIHSFLGLKLVQKKDQQILELDPHSPNATKMFDVLIVDEASMISTDLYLHIIQQAHRVRRAIIFLGDDCQLPPVEPEREDAIVSCSFSHGEKHALTEVLRQALENPIIALATDVRSCIGAETSHALDFLRSIQDNDNIMRIPSKFDVIETYYHMLMDETDDDMKKIFENTYKYKILSYTNKVVDDYNRLIRSLVVPDATQELMPGEPIVFEDTTLHCMYSNQQQIQCPELVRECWMGVDCWRLKGADAKSSFLIVGPETKERYREHLQRLVTKINLKETNPFTKKPYTWGDYYILKEKICVVGYPYACTGHKSQGSTFDAVWLDLAGMNLIGDKDNQARLLYTMITRPREYLMVKQ